MSADAKGLLGLLVAAAMVPFLLFGLLAVSLMTTPGRPDMNPAAAESACGVKIRLPGNMTLSSKQQNNTRVIIKVGKQMGVPKRGWVVALTAAHQESRLRNVNYGDRDSLGLFQQRASWGSKKARTTPRESARMFYQALRDTSGWRGMGIPDAAQAVQKSAYPSAYDDDVQLAATLVKRVTGTTAGCAKPAQASQSGPQQMLPMGLTPRTLRAKNAVQRRFDAKSIGGFCPGGCTSGHVEGSDHYDGHAFDVMIANWRGAGEAQGDRIARFVMSNSGRLSVKYVIWNGRINTGSGWRGYTHPSGATGPTVDHQDHVHVSVK